MAKKLKTESEAVTPPTWLRTDHDPTKRYTAYRAHFGTAGAAPFAVGSTEIGALDALQGALDQAADQLRVYRRAKYGRES